jgi:tetratricopeptide (TPR) repeat protein
VERAYAGEAASGARNKMLAEESKRSQKLAERREEVLNADGKAVKKLRENADAYSDYGQGDKALAQMQRVFASRNMDNLAESQAINARAKAVSGDFAGALSEADKAVAADNKNIYTYLNRADIYHMLGELDKALADIAQAKEIDKKNAVSYYLAAVIEDEQGNTEQAKADFAELYRLQPKAVSRIPDEYLQAISQKEYEKRQKDKAEARKKYAEEWKKAHKDNK